MAALKKIINHISQYMQILSGVFLIAIMLATLSDVFTRTLYGLTDGNMDFTFIGAVEIVKYGLLFTILFTLPQSVGSSQVIVDLFTENMSGKVKRYLEGFYLIGFALLGAGMSYRFFLSIESAQMSGETTQDLLLPMSWIYSIVVFATSILTLRCFVATCDVVHGHDANETQINQTEHASSHKETTSQLHKKEVA